LVLRPGSFKALLVGRNRERKGYATARVEATKRGEDLPPEIQHKRRQADPMRNMLARDHITERQFLVAIDIREAQIGIGTLQSSFSPLKFFLAGVSFSQVGDRVPSASKLGKIRRYKRWREVCKARKVRNTGVSWFEVAWAVVVDRRTPSDIDTGWGWRKGTAASALRSALDAYR